LASSHTLRIGFFLRIGIGSTEAEAKKRFGFGEKRTKSKSKSSFEPCGASATQTNQAALASAKPMQSAARGTAGKRSGHSLWLRLGFFAYATLRLLPSPFREAEKRFGKAEKRRSGSASAKSEQSLRILSNLAELQRRNRTKQLSLRQSRCKAQPAELRASGAAIRFGFALASSHTLRFGEADVNKV
jgi:hypothetical protein